MTKGAKATAAPSSDGVPQARAAGALLRFYNALFTKLTDTQRQALVIDVLAMVSDEGFETVDEAVLELNRRIGGPQNLPAYARTIVISYHLDP